MAFDGRYIANSQAYLETAYAALASRFTDREEFNAFYSALPDDATKDDFLRVASFYRYLVKNGDWYVHADDSLPVVDYLTNSYKLVALFSLIESLSGEEYIDFHRWLCQSDAADGYAIRDSDALSQLHEQYKKSFGSIRRCVAFFCGLPEARQKALCSLISIKGEPLSSIEKVAKFLYDLRSKFVHEARVVLQVSDYIVLSKGATVKTEVTLEDLLGLFEEGLVEWFRQKIQRVA